MAANDGAGTTEEKNIPTFERLVGLDVAVDMGESCETGGSLPLSL